MPVYSGKGAPAPQTPGGGRFSAVQVDCYAGYRADESPRTIREPNGRRLEIAHILGRWIEPRHRFFKAATADGRTCLLRQNVETLHWEVRFL